MTEEWFQKLLVENPDKEYLRYLGRCAIEPLISRQARDFQLIRYIPMEGFGDLNPYLLKDFAALYNSYRDYVVLTLYNRELEDIFVNYRPFMALVITMFVVNQICNRAVEHTNDFRFLDDKVIAIIFQMYGIPRDIIVTMTYEIQRKLVTSMLKLIRKKATNTVFYDLIRILGFSDVTINKLMLMKQQVFGDDGQAYFSDGEPINTFEDLDRLLRQNETTGKPEKEIGLNNLIGTEDWERDRNPTFDPSLARAAELEGKEYNVPELLPIEHPYRGLPYFQAVDLLDKNPYRTIVNEEATTQDYFTVTDADPRWWDLQDTRNLIRNKNYVNADSKYIMIESVIRETNYLYEVVYFMRLILDGKRYTDQIMINIPELFGTKRMSLFDLMVFLLAAMCYNNNLDGNILTSASGLLAIAGFNFEIDMTKFQEFLEKTEYADKERVMQFMNWISPKADPATFKFIFEEIMLPFKDWLTLMMSQCLDRQEYLEYEKIFRSTYSYDIAQQIFNRDFQGLDERLEIKYGVTAEELLAFKIFYPHHPDGTAITKIDFVGSPYDPFIGNTVGLMKTWYVTTGLGDLYLYDALNSDDLRYVTDADGKKVPNPVFWDPVAGEFDKGAVETAINEIKKLHFAHLSNAYFCTDTLIPGTNSYYSGIKYDSYGAIQQITYLPDVIRAEGTFKDILIDRISLAMAGEAVPPETYYEYLRRRNPTLFDLFRKAESSRNDWLNAIMIIVLAIEAELNMHLKIFEQAVAGTEMYFKPLVTLIKYFKSYMIDFTRSGIRYIFDSKIDPGGSSNMLKLFDEIFEVGWHIGINDEFGLYDTEHQVNHRWLIKDRAMMITVSDPDKDGLRSDDRKLVKKRTTDTGSLRMVDEAKFYLNGKEIDPSNRVSFWYSGEEGVGRFDMEHDRLDATYDGVQHLEEAMVDTDGWKEFVESSNPR